MNMLAYIIIGVVFAIISTKRTQKVAAELGKTLPRQAENSINPFAVWLPIITILLWPVIILIRIGVFVTLTIEGFKNK
jgi:hypothetical protein